VFATKLRPTLPVVEPRRTPASFAYGFHVIEPEVVALRDVSATFYDLSVLYDIVALSSLPEGDQSPT
jgi:hypothetical protein